MASGDPFLLTIAFYLNVVRTKRDMRVRPYLLVFAKCDIRLKIELFSSTTMLIIRAVTFSAKAVASTIFLAGPSSCQNFV